MAAEELLESEAESEAESEGAAAVFFQLCLYALASYYAIIILQGLLITPHPVMWHTVFLNCTLQQYYM